jgi:hypothetical protein
VLLVDHRQSQIAELDPLLDNAWVPMARSLTPPGQSFLQGGARLALLASVSKPTRMRRRRPAARCGGVLEGQDSVGASAA